MLKYIKQILFSKFSIIFLLIIAVISILIYLNSDGRVLSEFSNNIYKYPLPPKTVCLEKSQFDGKNWIDGGGSGGYWNVVASMKLSTELSKEEVLRYYKDLKFPYPKSNKPGVEVEIYFDNDIKKEECKEGFYYRSKSETTNAISSYFNEHGQIKDIDITGNRGTKLTYILQIAGSYDYFFNLD